MTGAEVHWTALAVFVGFFFFVTVLGFVAANPRLVPDAVLAWSSS